MGWFVFLFYAVWSSWIKGTLHQDLHGANELSSRVFVLPKMLAVAVMAMHAGDITGSGDTGFALAYAPTP